MSFIKSFLIFCLISTSIAAYGQRVGERANDENRTRRARGENENRPATTGSYTIDCIINGNCASAGDYISLNDLISDRDILSWKEGHGGYAVTYKGKTSLMDFIENGIESRPFFDARVFPDQNILSNVEAIFYNETASFQEKLAQKLTEIDKYSSELSFSYLAGIMSYNWIFVDFDLKPTPDIDSIAQLPGAIYTPLANRRQQTILIHSPSWKKLDDANKVGLILHELNYSMVVPTFDRLLLTNVDMRLGSMKARELTSYLFLPIVQVKKIRGFNTVSNNYIDFTFSDKRYDLSRIVWNNDGSVTLPVGKSYLEIQTQILKMDGHSKPQVINWGTAEKAKVESKFNFKALCDTSKRSQKPGRRVSINFYHTVKGNLLLKFNISEVSSLEIQHSNDLKPNDSWMFNFGIDQASMCERRIRNYVQSI